LTAFFSLISMIVASVLGVGVTPAQASVPKPRPPIRIPRLCVSPKITSISPTTADPSTHVVVTGTNFGANQGSGFLKFSDNGVNWGAPGDAAPFTLVKWTNTQITFLVPVPYGSWGTTAGTQASVTVTNHCGWSSNQVTIRMTAPPTFPTGHATSPNWAGYVTQNEGYAYVYGTWTVPKANCGTLFNNFTFASVASTWVGLDGYNSSTVEQIGTDSNCIANQGSYWAWFEMYPNLPTVIDIFSHPVGAGDIMNGSVISTGQPGWYTLRISDVTRNWNYQTTQYLAGATGANAEWITEQPDAAGLPFTNVGTVNFTTCFAGGDDAAAWNSSISHHPNIAVNMVRSDGTVKAVTSPLSSDGTSFNITWEHN